MMRLMIMEDPAKLEETVDHMGDEAEGGEVEGAGSGPGSPVDSFGVGLGSASAPGSLVDSSGVGLGSASSSSPGGKEGPQQKGTWSGPYLAHNSSFNLDLAISQVPNWYMRLSG